MRRLVCYFAFVLAVLTLSLTAAAGPKHGAPAAAPDPVKADEPEPAEAKPDDVDEVPAHHDPVTMKVGIVVTELNKFDLAQGTYNAELFVSVHCDREPCRPDLDVANGKITGKIERLHDEPLYKIFKMKAELSAIIDLSEYPFDNHALPIILEDKGDPEQIRYDLDTAGSSVKDDIRLPGWDVTQWAATVGQDDVGDGAKISQIHFAIEAKRPTLMATFKSVVPIVIMIFVAAFTLLLKPKSAAGRLSAATAGLMSIVMFQVGQVGSLPPIGYLTRLDKFMIATYLVYLLNIALTVVMVRMEEKKNERMSELMYLAAAGAVPGLAMVVWLSVFLRLV
jgi:hypothetical protein